MSGIGKIVQIDESLFRGKRKYNRGRLLLDNHNNNNNNNVNLQNSSSSSNSESDDDNNTAQPNNNWKYERRIDVIPLLHRMPNLEELRSYFKCSREKSFIDGNDLKANIINHLPRLKTFAFNICSFIDHYNQIDILTNEDIQNTFRGFPNNQIISCVNDFPDKSEVSLFDEHPFEHKFFLRIQKLFPLMEDLIVTNRKTQYEKSNNGNQDLPLIHYHHLACLDLTEVHDDYIEQFLLATKISLPFNLGLHVDYQSIRRVTHDFKKIGARINCSKINCLYSIDLISRSSKHFKKYFLSTARL
ncbi:unnamed protein product [Rotaria sp. Silwood2]|nr:unnamed protein product [Rotaria sp. Silwood2]CAF2501089.1 unnamed protein product [Rotaria sp. Silwood2]CAF3961979.1 unnamed protein product [Rotaria sp. Silwood2]CAF4080179.1 unnamed protein product [Rotaria sp. Silwood2]